MAGAGSARRLPLRRPDRRRARREPAEFPVAAGNVTVLTSSKADKLSREDEAWQHGAFTKVFLDALSDYDIDTDRNGVISMTDLTAYMAKRLDWLTGGDQQLGVEQRFQGEKSVAG